MNEAQEAEAVDLLNRSDEDFDIFKVTGDLSKLMEAIELLNLYNEEFQPSDDDSIGVLAFKLARCGQALYDRSRAVEDIANAILNAEASVSRVPSGLSDAERGLVLAQRCCILSKCLVSQGMSRDCRKPESLEKSLEPVNKALRELEAMGQNDSDGYFRLLWQKASCKQRLWDRDRSNVGDLESCVELTFKALELSRAYAGTDEGAQILGELATRLLRAYTYEEETGQRLAEGAIPATTYEKGLCEEAINYLEMAESLAVDADFTKLDNIISVTDYLNNIPEAAQRPLLQKLRGLLESNVKRLRDVMQTALKGDVAAHAEKYFGLSRDAAAAATEAGEDAFTALKILEEGRHITGIASLGGRAEFSDNNNTIEAEKFGQLKLRLDRLIEEEAPHQERRDALEALREFERDFPCTQIMTPESVTSLASEGPVVVINTTNVRSDAFIITHSGICSVWLPNLKELEVSRLSWKVQWRLAQDEGRDWDTFYPKLGVKMMDLYVYVWRHATKPILDNLGFQWREDDVSDWPRVCWISTGTLSLYPVGVTGFGIGQRGNGFNRVISTYAPSVKALLASRSRGSLTPAISAANSGSSAAVFAMKITPGHPEKDVYQDPDSAPEPKPWGEFERAEDEAGIIQDYLPTAEVKFQPAGQEVIETLRKGFDIVHFSCHGWMDYINPTKSMLLFDDWKANPLTVEKIAKAGTSSKLAVMSACSTANSGLEGLQDEPHHVASALFTAGFHTVVGTLWSVREEDGPVFTKEFYRHLSMHSMDGITTRVVAEALHLATMKVAEVNPNPAFWSPFVCFGI